MSSSPLSVKRPQLQRRKAVGKTFQILFLLATLLGVLVLTVLIVDIALDGWSGLGVDFLRNLPSRFPERAGIKVAIAGTLWTMGLTALITFPVGVGAAIYLEEFAPDNWITGAINTNISNLAGVPSIVYGLLGLGVFVQIMSMGPSVLAGSLTLSLLVLPIVIIASQEAIRAVPESLRHGGLALGATRLQVVRSHVLPSAMPGILTGTILALSRAIGETAPLIVVGAVAFLNFTPEGPSSRFTVLPLTIFGWTARPQEEFHSLAAAAILVLLAILLTMNMAAIMLRNHFQNRQMG